MKVSLIALHLAQYAGRLALSLAETCEVQLHITRRDAEMELTPELRMSLAQRLHLVLHERAKRKTSIYHGWRLSSSIRAFRADIIHAQDMSPWPLAAMVSMQPKRLPFILTVHDPLPHSGSDEIARARDKWPHALIRRRANRILVHGAHSAKDMASAEPTAAGRIHSIPHGILGDYSGPEIASEPASFIFFGRIEAYKGLGVLLAACHLLSEKGHRYRVTIAGRGSDLENHRSQIAANPNVTVDERFIPAEEAPRLLRRSGVVVMPYLDATQSGVLASAFAAGRTVIASRVGGLPEVVEEEKNGLLVPPGDPEALARAMERMILDPGLVADLSRGATVTANTRLSWNEIARATRDVYRSALAEAAAR